MKLGQRKIGFMPAAAGYLFVENDKKFKSCPVGATRENSETGRQLGLVQ
jgi:hypothetical protein